MEKKAIFGGTFDPIHIGHIHIAYEAIYNLSLDKIIFMPTGNPPHKNQKEITDAKIRYELVKIATEGETYFDVSDYEINRKQYSYTYETVQYFHETYSNVQWHFLTGVDGLMNLLSWKNVEEILENCKLVVFNRPGYELEDILCQKELIEKKYEKEIEFLDMPLLDISSTNIRQNIRLGRNVDYLLPKNVEKYINAFHLYK